MHAIRRYANFKQFTKLEQYGRLAGIAHMNRTFYTYSPEPSQPINRDPTFCSVDDAVKCVKSGKKINKTKKYLKIMHKSHYEQHNEFFNEQIKHSSDESHEKCPKKNEPHNFESIFKHIYIHIANGGLAIAVHTYFFSFKTWSLM